MKVEGSLKELARLGDALINFVASAALSLRVGRAQGVKVPDKLLREVASMLGLRGLGELMPEDIVEALVAYSWLKGFSSEEMVKVALEGLSKGRLEEGLAALVRRLSRYYEELLAQARGGP